jgi:hypothetical protein
VVPPEVLAALAEPVLPTGRSSILPSRSDRSRSYVRRVKVTNPQEYDHAPMRTLCRVNLEAAGFRVLETADGDEALAASRSTDLT